MGIQDKLANFNYKAVIKLSDLNIHNVGDLTRVIRLKTTQDKYGDEEVELISFEEIELYLDIPEGIPLTRLRDSLVDNVATTESIYLYEILPIEAYTKFEDNVEKGDVIIKKITVESDKNNFKLMILRISETIGNISHGHLTLKKFNCAPEQMIFPESINAVIMDYLNN